MPVKYDAGRGAGESGAAVHLAVEDLDLVHGALIIPRGLSGKRGSRLR